ncbi:hypothetical protein BH10BDE1_BH10BDE1_15180 [soil metagenome]
MPSPSSTLALALLIIAFGLDANAHPGAKAEDYNRSVEIKSTCATDDNHFQTIVYGYTTPSATPDAKGNCPASPAVALRSYLQPQPNQAAAEKAGVQVIHVLKYFNQDEPQQLYTVNNQIQYFENGRIAILQPIDEARMSEMKALLSLATQANPITANFSYATRSLVEMKRASTEGQHKIKIVATCTENGNIYGYTVQGQTRSDGHCNGNFQFIFKSIETPSATEAGFNYVSDYRGPVYNTFEVHILSQFSLPLFNVKSTCANYLEARRNFVTASSEHPVEVTVDEAGRAVLSIVPTISPYAL